MDNQQPAQPTPEQVAAMKEKLKNMSPEEIQQLQKQQCIFCKIVSGEIESKRIYEDNDCLALLDINPANPGHMLLLPKEHYPIMPLMPEQTLAHMAKVTKALSQASLKALKAQGTTIFIANGALAGQRAQHFMLHIIPRMQGDDVQINIPKKTLSDADKKVLREKLRPGLAESLGMEVAEKEDGEREKEESREKEEQDKEDKGEEEREDEETEKEEQAEKKEDGEREKEESREKEEQDKEDKGEEEREDEETEKEEQAEKKEDGEREKEEEGEEIGLDDISRVLLGN